MARTEVALSTPVPSMLGSNSTGLETLATGSLPSQGPPIPSQSPLATPAPSSGRLPELPAELAYIGLGAHLDCHLEVSAVTGHELRICALEPNSVNPNLVSTTLSQVKTDFAFLDLSLLVCSWGKSQ